MSRLSSHALFSVLTFSVLLSAIALALSCAGASNLGPPTLSSKTGTITVSITDPPTCGIGAGGPFKSVWVTITRVRAHISADAGENEGSWVDLVDLRSQPKQIDLLSLGGTSCVLTQLGSSTGLTPGNYQQIRLHLLSNSPGAGVATPSPNRCAGNGYNCVVLQDDTTQTLLLSSQAQTGIKVPPGQIAGGAISLKPGEAADISIDFNACASILRQGNGDFRLKPVLTAGQVVPNKNFISGRVVDSLSKEPIPNVVVLVEQPDAEGVGRVKTASVGASDGAFIVCPLPTGEFYDVVIAARTTSATGVITTYNATIVFQVPVGTALGDIPLVPEPGLAGSNSLPAEIEGLLTSAGSGGAIATDITLSALQAATPMGGSTRKVTVPVFDAMSQPPNFTTKTDNACPAGTYCVEYNLKVPGSNPHYGTFNASGTTYAPPDPGNIVYSVNAQAPSCDPAGKTVNSLTVYPGGQAAKADFTFTGCN